jgi:hypothetical protein
MTIIMDMADAVEEISKEASLSTRTRVLAVEANVALLRLNMSMLVDQLKQEKT